MMYTMNYESPLGDILLAADDEGLTGLWFVGEKYFAEHLDPDHTEKPTPVLLDAKKWLDIYFSGKKPDFTPKLHLVGTDFRLSVWEILLQIPYGETTTYGKIAEILAAESGVKKMSARAVGGAVGHNEISIIVPCHRVLGSKGNLTGFAAGLDKKIKLLALENVDMKNIFVPKKGTAL